MRYACASLATTGMLLALATPAIAQDAPSTRDPIVVPATPAGDAEIEFTADRLEYSTGTDTVTALGQVRLVREGNRVRADRLTWNRRSGEVRAEGNVVVVNPGGDAAYGETVVLTDTLRQGAVDDLLLVLADGSRLVARRGTVLGAVSTLDQVAYTPCPVIDDGGCPRRPSWQINAVRVIRDEDRKRIVFDRAQLELFGVKLPTLPRLVISTGPGGTNGILMPSFEYSRNNGFEIAVPYYRRLAPNRDVTIIPHIYTATLPAIEVSYRALSARGAYRVGGFATYSTRLASGTTGSGVRDFRGYFDASGRFQLDPQWSIHGSIRRATDRTVLRRYDISREDKLRSVLQAERIDRDSYFSAAGWAVQTLRATELQGANPVALPELDYRRRLTDPLFGGRVEVQLNGLALTRDIGQETQRVFASSRWDLRGLTRLGQEVVVTAYARGDLYNSSGNALTPTALYRGAPGVQARGIAAVAAEVRWPFIGPFLTGTQRLTPRLQVVASPATRNLAIPNEDSRAVDLEDSNLFALNRFPGYDRWEDGTRVTYGIDYAFDAPRIAVNATVGQSYRLTAKPTLFPDGTGLTDRLSDVVGRITARYRNLVSVTGRFRLDKDGLAVRRNEIDATIGSDRTYALIGYLRLNRNIPAGLEDLQDHEEIRLGGRVQVTKYVSVFGSTTVDLTDALEDPATIADGYQPVRHRIGIAYTDACLDIGFTWRRDYQATGDARSGNSFLLRLAFRGLGR